jgi:hypothetical protein
MARKQQSTAKVKTVKRKRRGVHSKNASKGQNAYKSKSRGQGSN